MMTEGAGAGCFTVRFASPNMPTFTAAKEVARLLAEHDRKIVLAESCTGGLVSGALAAIPGISQHLCGGVVVYRNATKVAYLGIAGRILSKPGPVSELVAKEMALSVLRKTPEATLAVSVTGHLGPDAPAALDGQVFVGLASRRQPAGERIRAQVQELKCRAIRGRVRRQRWVVERVLAIVARHLEAMPRDKSKETN